MGCVGGRWLVGAVLLLLYLFQVGVGVLGGDGKGFGGGSDQGSEPCAVGCIIGRVGRALLGLLSILLGMWTLSLFATAGAVAIAAEVPPFVTVEAFDVLLRLLPLFASVLRIACLK